MSDLSSIATSRLPRVWILGPRVDHYRTAVFDGIRERGRADRRYDLSVLGTLQDGRAFGGQAREYFRSCPQTDFRVLGASLCRWPDAERLVEGERPDVVVLAANPRNTTTWTLPALCRRLGIPVVGWTKLHSYSSLAPVMPLIKPTYYRRFTRMICYGESGRRELVALGYPAERTTVAHNTIDTRMIFTDAERIRARSEAIRSERGLIGKRILLNIGRMNPDKRHRDLIEAWPSLKALDSSLVMVLVGDGPLATDLRAAAAAMDPERILVTGRVPEGEDYAWIAASDICVYPGAVGLAINQSLALGRPTVIADERGSDSEVLIGHGPGQTGWRFPRGDRARLVTAVRWILEHPGEVATVAERGRALVRDQWTLENMIDAIDGCIRETLAEFTAGSRGHPSAA
ncbi:MAG TPA: glycosyltransferase family 4 protein [Candidatus Eisenbacteria bacterium]|nr:glycosyltransferase family 4 protein [Candidatus Eisenbacteria bacterium]